jgi:hypothetical protein
MTDKTTNETATDVAQKPAQASFYGKLEALHPERHGDLRLKPGADFRFARNANAIPITDVEFAAASRFHPIVFTPDQAVPMVTLGLQQENLFVGDEGSWNTTPSYVPAYLRRYPFIFIENGDQFVLGVDRECDRVTDAQGEGEPLFVDGKPSAFTRDVLNFTAQLHNQHLSTRAFGAALIEQKLLIDRQAQASLPDGRRFNVAGFQIVDAQKFQALPDAVVTEWHKKGWLGLVHFHLASLERFHDLMGKMPRAAA